MVSNTRVQEILAYLDTNGKLATLDHFGLTSSTLQRYLRSQPKDYESTKKEPIFNWREWSEHLKERQELSRKASGSEEDVTLSIQTKYPCIVLKPLADMHIGSLGMNFERLEELTDSILKIPYLYLSLLGDEEDNFVSFKNQLPMLKQVLSPDEQDAFLESWLEEIDSKLLFATWGNHGAFEEKVSGRNTAKHILSRNTTYFNGIGICRLKVNEQVYEIVATHTTRFNSSLNKTHGLKQLARRDIPNADVYLAGHIHDPAYEVSFERGKDQIFMVLGSLKEHDSHSQRYFSYFSAKRDGALVFDTITHKVLPFPSLEDALEYAKFRNGGSV